jgi:parallel beta-helix repeat protein
VVKVGVSVDGGLTYSEATGTTAWSFNLTPNFPGQATIMSRAVDNTGNLQNPPTQVHFIVDAPPTSTITSPKEGGSVLIGKPVTITGIAFDPGGPPVVKVEVSVDGGANYSAATRTDNTWSFNWTPPSEPEQVTIKSRAVDNTGNVQDPPAEITVTVRAPVTTIRVPSDRPTIQAAITFALDGEMALVAPGTYVENIDFEGKAITVTSESGPNVTIIDGGNANPVVSITSGEGRDSVLNGFTLQHGSNGGGIKVMESSPTITNNVIKNNQGCFGGGIMSSFGSPLIQRNTITGNNTIICGSTPGIGGGISIREASSVESLNVEILDNLISDNMAFAGAGGGIALSGTGTPIVSRNTIKGNTSSVGGGIYIINETDALIVQNLIIGNQAGDGGGLYWGVPSFGRGPRLVNNTIADNNATGSGSGIFAGGFAVPSRTELINNIIVAKPGQSALSCSGFPDQNQPITRFNNIFSAGGIACNCSGSCAGNGNISADPRFTNPTQGDYHLQQGSPSIDSGDNLTPNLPDKDLDGHPRILDGDGNGTAIVDMGVYEFLAPPRSVWNFIPRRPRSFTAKIQIGVGSPNTLSSIPWAIPFKLDGRRIVKGSSLWDSSRR